MNKEFSNGSIALFEDDVKIEEAFDEIFNQIHEHENDMSFDQVDELWTKVAQSEKMIVNETNFLLKNEGLQSSIESEMKTLKNAEASLEALKKRHLALVHQHKEKQRKVLSSIDQVHGFVHTDDTDIEHEKKTLQNMLECYSNQLLEIKKKILAKKQIFS